MSSNENTIEKEDNSEKFKALQKRFFKLGIIFLVVAMGLYVLLHSLAENPHIIIEFFIFAFAISSVILIFIGLVMTKDTNWFSLVGSIVFLLCCLLVLIFYPDQEFQTRLNIISLVAIIGTLLFGVFDVFINAVFFPSKNAEIRQSVDFVSNRFAVDVLTVTLIIGTLFGTIAYLFFVPNNNLSLFLGGIDIKTVALATAGLVTFFWAAKAAKNKSIELEEKKQDGKRRDKEIKMAEARDTAQLIAKASELLGSESDAQKNAGLAFLNRVASQKGGPLQKEAFDLLADFILSDADTKTSNKPRIRAINYINKLREMECVDFNFYGRVEICGDDLDSEYENGNHSKYLFDRLALTYKNFSIYADSKLLTAASIKIVNECFFCGITNSPKQNFEKVLIWPMLCQFETCDINLFEFYGYDNKISEGVFVRNFSTNEFLKCNFSDYKNWQYVRFSHELRPNKKMFDKCFYYAGHPPHGFDKERDGAFLTEITSEQQFDELVGNSIFMKYSPPDDDKTPND